MVHEQGRERVITYLFDEDTIKTDAVWQRLFQEFQQNNPNRTLSDFIHNVIKFPRPNAIDIYLKKEQEMIKSGELKKPVDHSSKPVVYAPVVSPNGKVTPSSSFVAQEVPYTATALTAPEIETPSNGKANKKKRVTAKTAIPELVEIFRSDNWLLQAVYMLDLSTNLVGAGHWIHTTEGMNIAAAVIMIGVAVGITFTEIYALSMIQDFIRIRKAVKEDKIPQNKEAWKNVGLLSTAIGALIFFALWALDQKFTIDGVNAVIPGDMGTIIGLITAGITSAVEVRYHAKRELGLIESNEDKQ